MGTTEPNYLIGFYAPDSGHDTHNNSVIIGLNATSGNSIYQPDGKVRPKSRVVMFLIKTEYNVLPPNG